jgi:hypothetical protein
MVSAHAERSRVGRARFAAVIIALALAACGNDTAVRLVLAPDTEINSIEDVLARVTRFQIVVDAEGGLSGVDQPGPTSGGGEAADRDSDGELEVVFTTGPVPESDDLPVLEIGLEDNADRELSFQVLGYAADGELTLENALGLGASAASCGSGQTCRVGTPFNLLARARAPRVVWVMPPDGTMDVPKNLAYVTAVFSTTVVEETVAPNMTLAGREGHVPATTAELRDVVYGAPPDLQEVRSMLRLILDEPLQDRRYDLEIGPGIVGTNDLRFDQRQDEEGENPFTSVFGNEVDALGCPDGYEWDDEYEGCVFTPDCATACEPGYVCDSVALQCVEDCRIYQGCIRIGETCSDDTGLCS